MINRASDENSVRELGDLDGDEGERVAGVGDSLAAGEELLEAIGDVSECGRVNDGVSCKVFGGGMDEVNAGVVALNMDIAVGISEETAGEGRENGESDGERALKREKEVREGKRRRREEDALLDVVAREHGEIGDGELEGFHGGRRLVRVDGGLGDDGGG